ncbi:MAG TPA: hypothetical protein VM599_04775 [Thermoanaerobaculia bacterium]|nr:hypothetical protein [Thermoanaerobaculia bacterium]
MRAFGLRRTAALVLAVALLIAAAPAAGAAPERAACEPGIGPWLFRAVTTWLAALWPGAGPASAPVPAWEALRSGLDPAGTPKKMDGEPKAEPQHGSTLDPDG